MPYKCRCVEFGQNFGVSGGRNRLYREVKTEWIFQLDNDVYFISNPLKKIQKDIAVLGCHFLCVPVLNEKIMKRLSMADIYMWKQKIVMMLI